jgi:O-antigen/teichoic acid export membrane protein
MAARSTIAHRYPREVLTLIGGSALGQSISVIGSVIVARQYTPADFGHLAIYSSLVVTLTVVATGRYELAVMLAEQESDADDLVLAVQLLCLAFCAIGLPVFVVAGQAVAMDSDVLAPWLVVVPVHTLLSGAYAALSAWLNRHRRYASMSHAAILQSAVTSLASIGLGLHRPGVAGLVVGALLGQAASAAFAYGIFRRRDRTYARTAPVRARVMAQLRKYADHPKYLLPAHWIGAIATQMPVMVISSAFGPMIAGFYSLAARMVSIPVVLVGNAIGSVYRQSATRAYAETGSFRRLFITTVCSTSAIAIVPLAVGFWVAPAAFALFFGETWRVAGEYARVLLVGAFFQFALTPVDKGALIVGASRYIVAWQVARLLGMCAIMLMSPTCSFDQVLCAIVALNVVLYVVDGLFGYRFSGFRRSQTASRSP